MPKTRLKNEMCVYCGSTEALTDDHIPPKSLFPKPRPSNLITVCSCRNCNEGSSKDDECFRLMVSMRHDTGDHPAVKRIIPSILRSLQNPAKKGFKQALFESIGIMDIVSCGGVYLGSAEGYDVDFSRLDRVAARITTGLFYHHIGRRIPSGFCVTSYIIDGIGKIDAVAKERMIDLFGKTTRNEPHTIGEGVFSYWYQMAHNHDTASLWVLAFYKRIIFLCFVSPSEDK